MDASEQVRTAELIGTLCLATDLGMGFPFEHGLHTTIIAMRPADQLGVDRETRVLTCYVSLLTHAGCTTDAHLAAETMGSSITEHMNPVAYGSTREMIPALFRTVADPGATGLDLAAQVIRRLPRVIRMSIPELRANCEVAGMLATQTGAPARVEELLAFKLERWDGRGALRRGKGEAINESPGMTPTGPRRLSLNRRHPRLATPGALRGRPTPT